ncbi:Protein O-mannosyltransferase 2 [Coemansia sp. RSA 1365]|nr:Protein O-mannosyltransferase 2 [Coemansia sp. RSA 1365]
MASYRGKPAVFYDQSTNFDDMHLPARPAGFSAYPTASKGTHSGTTAAFANRGGSRRWAWLGGTSERAMILMLTLVAVVTKLYRIGRRNSVSWDEAHFGKFGAYYLNQTFYHDVHPPLAKMLVGLSELLAGHNGSFDFKGGHTYPAYVNYRFMRVFNAGFGIALTPMAYVTCRRLRMPTEFAAMAALFVTFDNALCVMSRFILLDAPLLGFTGLALTMFACFYRQRQHPFSTDWWRFLLLTGLSLGLVASAKWVGLFAVALVGCFTIVELFEMYCNTRLPMRIYAKHWAARIVTLIVIPLCVYALCFKVHFSVLSRYRPAASFMPIGFQTKMRGNPISRQPYEIHTGSAVRLQSHTSATGYLHSHSHNYPMGSMRQQITGYGYADPNNIWNIRRVAAAGSFQHAEDVLGTDDPIAGAIGNGDIVALQHNSTNTYLHADPGFEAPFSKQYKEVSAMKDSEPGALSSNSLWVVEIVNPERRMDDGHIHPLGTPIRLRSAAMGCTLLSTGERLDKNWGWNQAEIACDIDKSSAQDSKGYLWTIERHINANMTSVNLGKFMSSSFLRDLGAVNRQMWITNNALVPDHDKHNVLESGPTSWPFMVYPMRMVGWDDDSIKYLEIGNPLLWWASATVCLVFPLQLFYWLVCWQRRSFNWKQGQFRDYIEGAMMLWGGWLLHYLPFFLMGRVTYLHHYLPALYFSILFLAYQIFHTCSWYMNRRGLIRVLYVCVSVVVFTFWWFSPLTYGWDKPIKDLKGMQWVSSWPVYTDKFAF